MHERLRLGLEALEEQVLLSFVAGRFLPCEPTSSTYPVAFPKSHKSYISECKYRGDSFGRIRP
jgi:hypothetical protein